MYHLKRHLEGSAVLLLKSRGCFDEEVRQEAMHVAEHTVSPVGDPEHADNRHRARPDAWHSSHGFSQVVVQVKLLELQTLTIWIHWRQCRPRPTGAGAGGFRTLPSWCQKRSH